MALPPVAGAGAMPPPDPGAGPGAGPAPDDAGDDSGGDDVVVTISKAADGTYMVYAGDEPDEGGGGGADMSEDDEDAMGGAGGGMGAGAAAGPPGGGSAGQPADSIGAALKLAMDIMQADKSSEGAPGSADDQFAAGFGASKAPTPVGMGGGA